MNDDLVSKQAAIDALDGEIEITGRTNAEAVKGYVRLVKDRLERLPSADLDLDGYSERLWKAAYERGKRDAEQKRMKGRWQEVYAETDYRNGWIEFSCECCEYQHGLETGEYGWYYGDEIPWKYCPLCGADMRGEQDE